MTGWKHLRPVYVYTALVVCLIAVTRGERFSFGHHLLLIALGVLSWTLIEYALHRFAFHYNHACKIRNIDRFLNGDRPIPTIRRICSVQKKMHIVL